MKQVPKMPKKFLQNDLMIHKIFFTQNDKKNIEEMLEKIYHITKLSDTRAKRCLKEKYSYKIMFYKIFLIHVPYKKNNCKTFDINFLNIEQTISVTKTNERLNKIKDVIYRIMISKDYFIMTKILIFKHLQPFLELPSQDLFLHKLPVSSSEVEVVERRTFLVNNCIDIVSNKRKLSSQMFPLQYDMRIVVEKS